MTPQRWNRPLGRHRFLTRARLVVGLIGILIPVTSAAQSHQPAPPGPSETGLARGRPGGPCNDKFEVRVQGRVHGCTHGADPAPPGVDQGRRDPVAAPSEPGTVGVAGATGQIPCYGDGTTGNRVQAIYAFPAGTTDRYSTVVDSIRTWAAAANQVITSSAAETGGVRHVRFFTDSNCELVVNRVQLPADGATDFAKTISALQSAGFNRADRKYLVWVDAKVYCGIGEIYFDDQAGQANFNNGGRPMFARIDTGCWGLAGQSVEAHELMHNLGGVQRSAPHATAGSHCSDESDRMCYDDRSGVILQQLCPTEHENVFDCNHDDYFHTAPPAGSYLATKWNTANSSFLASTQGSTATTTTTSTTTTTVSPTTTSTSTTSTTVVSSGTIRVLSPNGGERWRRGMAHTVRWSYTGAPGSSVTIQLLNQAGSVVQTITSSASLGTGGSGAYRWTPSTRLSPGRYQVRITVNGSSVLDRSDSLFSLT